MDRSNTYKTMDTLQKLGIVEKIVGIPHFYVVIPVEYAIPMLLKKKEREYAESKKKSAEFLKKYVVVHEQSPEEEYFTILPGKEAFIKKWEKTLKAVEHSVNIVATEKREPKDAPISEIYRDLLLPKGVKVNWIVDRSRRDKKRILPEGERVRRSVCIPKPENENQF